jgi:hypothetical protein
MISFLFKYRICTPFFHMNTPVSVTEMCWLQMALFQQQVQNLSNSSEGLVWYNDLGSLGRQ